MERLKLAGFGRNGAVLDVAEYDAPPESFNEVRNARFNSTGAVAFSGHKSVLSPAPITPLWLRVFPPVDFPRWVYADLSKVYVFDDGHIDISRSGGYAGNANERWQGEIFSGVGIFNNTIDVPQMWPAFNSATQLADLDNWPTNIRCKALRPFKNYLIAMYLIEDGNDHPFRVRWSHPADPGTVPISWDISNPAYDAGEMEFSETDDYLVDGKTLGESFIVYKQKTAHTMFLTGNSFIFGQRTIISGRGALTRDCVQDIPGGHFVAGLDDIYVHSGQKGSEQSLVEAKVRKWIYNQIDASNYFNCFTVDYKSENEIWFCFPEAGETYATIAMVWNKVTGGIGFRDLQQTPFIWSGQVDERTEDGDIWGGEEVNLTAEGALTIGLPTVEGSAEVEELIEDPFFGDVVLLLHWEGSDGSTTFIDHSSYAHTVTAVGNAQVSTTDPLFGTGSLLLDGAGDYASVPVVANGELDLTMNGDFTIEFWFRGPSVTTGNYIIAAIGDRINGTKLGIIIIVSGDVITTGPGAFVGWDFVTGNTALSNNTWHHYAVVRNGSTAKAYVDGVEQTNIASNWTGTFNLQTGYQIGSGFAGEPFYTAFPGQIYDFRITAAARYTTGFTPPSAQFPDA